MTRRRRRNRQPRDKTLKNTQITVWVPRGPRERFPGMYPRMFVEDVTNGLMPYRSRALPSVFRLQPDNDDLEATIAEAFAIGHASGDTLDSTLSEFIRLTGAEILHEGRAIFEIIYFSDKNDAIVGFQLFFIDADTVREKEGKLIQVVPPDVAEQRKVPTEVVLSSDRLVVIEAVPAYRSYLPKLMQLLVATDGLPSPEWAMRIMTGEEKNPVPHDVSAHNLTRKQVIAQAARRVGWNVRFLIDEDTTEHYLYQRQLRFEAFKIEMRDEIVKGINRSLQMAGERMGFEAQMELIGVPTLADVEAAQRRLTRGEGSFGEITKTFYG